MTDRMEQIRAEHYPAIRQQIRRTYAQIGVMAFLIIVASMWLVYLG